MSKTESGSQNESRTETLIVGAGMTGLSLSLFLREAGHKVTLVEKSDQPGGCIRSEAQQGFWLEYGPNTFMLSDQGEDRRLFALAGLENDLIQAREAAAKRYIARNGALHKLSPNLPAMMKAGLLDFGTIGKIATDPLRRGRLPVRPTVAEFFGDRLGQKAVDNLVGPFVSGIYAGDPAQLSAAHAFPKLFSAFANKKSLIRGVFSMPKSADGRPKSYWLSGGLQTIARRIADLLGDDYIGGADVRIRTGGDKPEAVINGSSRQFDHVVVTIPLSQAGAIFGDESLTLPSPDAVPYGSVALIHFAFGKPLPQLDGFGFLVSLQEDTPLLGVLFNSSSFPERAPQDGCIATAFCGGLLRKKWLEHDDDTLVAEALASFRHFTGITAKPMFGKLTRVTDAIPQYPVTHDQTLAQVQGIESANPGLHFVANWLHGISVPDRIRAAAQLRDKLTG